MRPRAIASRLTRAWSLSAGSKGCFARAVGNELERPKEPAPANVADERVLPKALLEAPLKPAAHFDHVGEKAVAPDDVLDRERRRRGHRMTHVGVPVLKRARAVRERFEYPLRHEDRADRLVAAPQPLGDRHQIGRHALLLAGVKRSRSAHAAHHFVEDEQHAVAVADRPDALEIVADRRHGAGSGADHGLGHEGDDAFRADFDKLVLERLSGPRRIIRVALALSLQPVGIAGVDVVRLDQERLELRAPPRVSAGGEGAERIAVVALAPRDDMAALRLADLDEILARHLERRLDRLRTAAHQIDAIEAGGSVLDQTVGEAFGGLGGEKGGVRVGELIELLAHGGEHVRMSVAEA